MTSLLMCIAVQDLMQVALAVACVFAGWSLQTSACSFFLQRWTTPLKVVEYCNCSGNDDSTEEEQDGDFVHKEVLTQDEDLPRGLKILEQYGVLGAVPGAWTCKVASAVM
eukprot:TRINITY_DN99079_c0_g1_i1.p1 TRINITY_DN99079_c0_g1~~TRINITY_DN99079_c0_g1_i1.p1  ORF type:complete len:110 (+),score=24.45 TRINITY_DN99079_c0_g1_i1:149-478(+)